MKLNLIISILILSLNLTVVASEGYQAAKDSYLENNYQLTLERLSPLIDNGNTEAINLMGVMYLYGNGVETNVDKAIELFKQAAEQGNVDAQNNLGEIYIKYTGSLKDYEEAVKWYTKAAEQGNARAQFNLGWMYIGGQGVPQDYKEALKWYTKAAEQGDKSAQVTLGLMYESGIGASIDNKEAFKWYELSAKQGDDIAQYTIGRMYHKGIGVAKDNEQAFKWYRLAAKQKHPEAQANLALLYKKTEGVSKITVGNQLINIPAIDKFINAAPYNNYHHQALAESKDSISFVLKEDKDKFINGEKTNFNYQLILRYLDDVRLDSPSEFKDYSNRSLNASIADGWLLNKQIIDRDNAVGYMFTVDGLNTGVATLFVKGRVVTMILASNSNNNNKNEPIETLLLTLVINNDKNELIESDLKEWVDLILEANK